MFDTATVDPNDGLQPPGGNCSSGKLSMRDMLIPFRGER
jgi:hypothetical protein